MTTPTLQLNEKFRLVMQTDRQKVVNTEYAQLGTRELSQRVMEEANANPWLRPGWFDARESGSAGRNDGRAPWHRSGTDLAARGKAPPLDEQPAPRSLHDELERQLLESRLSDCELRVGMAIVHSIDNNGLLTESVASLARMLSVPVEDVSAVLACVQGFDPAGVGAHNATEAILIQLRQLPSGTRWQREAIAVLTDHAGLVEARQFADVRRRMNLDAEALEAVFRLIRRQRLRPGAGFASAPTEFAVPEVLVRKIDRGWTVELDRGVSPTLLVGTLVGTQEARTARRSVREPGESVASAGCRRAEARQQLRDARAIAVAVQYRSEQMLRVAREIVALQAAFFELGPAHRQPLLMRELAARIGLDDSSVSRIVAGKYMATPHGVFSLRSFFASGVATVQGDVVALSQLCERIKVLVRGDGTGRAVSDECIASQLRSEGLVVARRTVAKYRLRLGLSSRVQVAGRGAGMRAHASG